MVEPVLEDVESIKDPILRAELAGEVMAEAKRLRDSAICEAAQELSVRQIAEKIKLGKSTINEIVRAEGRVVATASESR